MIRKLLVAALLVTTAAFSALADYSHDLQFTNLTLNANLPLAGQTNQLNAVVYGGSSNFVAVGRQQVYVNGHFAPGQPWFTNANWSAGNVVSSGGMVGSNLTAVASSGNLFVAGGDNNWIFTSPNGMTWSTNNFKVFNNNALLGGLAYNGGNFVAAGEAPEISYTNNPPQTTNWIQSTFTNLSFAESYRGITPYGANGFAVCGIFGLVRLSTDAGQIWQQPLFGNIGQPDFYGIATDGTNTFVCVGATNATVATDLNGMILVSTNHGTTWQVAVNNAAAVTPINSVAYTGSGFVAVGNSGQILTSTNGVNWAVVPPARIPFAKVSSATNLNLNGVTFATAGYMHDVGEIVGANGNVIITAPPPPTNNSLGNKWICVGVTNLIQVGTNTALPANTLQVTNAWGTNVVAVDWYDAPAGGNQITTGTFITNGMYSFTPPFITTNSDNYTNTYYAQARDLRTGFVNTNRTAMTLTNFMRPTAAMITTNIICNGDTTTIQANLAGNGPWTVYWTDGFTFFTNTVGSSGIVYANNPYTTTLNLPSAAFNVTNLFLNAATNHYFWVWKLTDSYFPPDDPTVLNPTGTNWSSDLTGTDLITVNPRPTATLVTTNTICNGDTTTLQANLTGIGPWLVYWTDGVSNYTQTVSVNGAGPYTNYLTIINSAFNPTNLFLNAATNHYYSVYALSDTNCSANSSDIHGTNLITVNPRPTATLVTTNTICNGDTTVLQANLTGIGPWIVNWTDGVSNYTQTVSVNGAGPYTDNLTIINSAFNPTNLFLNAATNHYYSVYALSDTNCSANSSDIAGTDLVKVNPRPTATLVTSNTICNGDATVLQANLTGIGPWIVNWTDGVSNYTQTVSVNGAGPYTNYLTIINSAFNPTNLFLNAATNYYYSVFALSDTNCSANASDLNGTNLITVNPRPTASLLSFNSTNCNEGSVYTLTNTLTGLGPWVITWNDGLIQTNTDAPAGPVIQLRTVYPTNSFAANVASNNIYYVTSVSNADTCLGNQLGDITGAVTNTINPRPTASLLSFNTTNCNEGPVYTLTNTLTGVGPWVVTWNDGLLQTNITVGAGPVKLTRTVYPTNSFGANSPSNNVYYVANVVDADGCAADQPGDLTGAVTNTINPRPTTTMPGLLTTNCNIGTSYTFTNTLTGLGPWVVYWNDGFKQTNTSLAGGPTNILRTVIPTNELGANLPSNNVYYVTAVSNLDTCIGNLPGDILGTNVITVNPRPTAILASFNTTNCDIGASYIFTNTLTGIGPWSVFWNDGLVQTSNTFTVTRTVTPTNGFGGNLVSNYVYYVTTVSNADTCAGNFAGDIKGTNRITINPRPTAMMPSLLTTNCNIGTSYIFTNTLTGLGPWVVYWNDGFSQTNTSVGSGPATLTRTVIPTNSLAANAVSNSIYYVTAVSNADTCIGNQPGDILGTNVLTINPRPTSTLRNFSATNCNVGQGYWLTNVLTGIGPWTNVWSLDGQTFQQVVGSVGQAGPFTNSLLVSPTNGVGANTASNNVYYVASLINGDTCSGNQPGDILGTNTLTINPRPTATIIQVTNSYYSLVTFDDLNSDIDPGNGIQVTNGYANLDWVNFYADDVVNNGYANEAVSSNNIIYNYHENPVSITNATPFTLASAYMVAHGGQAGVQILCLGYTNASLAYSNVCSLDPSNPILFVLNYSNVTEVDFTTLVGGTPTAAYFDIDNVTIKQAGPTEEICNGGPAILQAALTGIKPWSVTWSDGAVSNNITTNLITRIVPASEVTNVFLNNTTNYTFKITSISDANACSGNQPGDLVGTASVTVSPRPTAFVSGNTNISVNGTNQYATPILANLTGFGPWNVTWSDGITQTWTNASPATRTVTNSLGYFVKSFTNYVYQRLRSSGSSTTNTPLTSTDPGSIPAPDSTNSYYTNNTLVGTLVVAPNINTNAHKNQWQLYPANHSYGGGFGTRYWNYFTVQTNVITTGPTNAIVTATFIYTVTNLVDATTCTANSNDLTGSAKILLALSATADVSTPGSTNICLNDPVLAVAVFSGTPPWTIRWSDGTTNIVQATNNPYSKYVTPKTTGWFNYTITNLVDGTNGVSTNITGGVAVYVNPIPLGVPTSNGNQTNCAGNANPPLTVTDGALVSWYDADYNLVASGTNSFTPSATDPGVYTYYAAETNSFGCTGTNVQVNLVILACTNPPAITYSGANGVGSVQWFGNLTLQSTTNLLPTVIWNDVFTNGIIGTNILYWTNGVPPWTNPYYFFRLNTN